MSYDVTVEKTDNILTKRVVYRNIAIEGGQYGEYRTIKKDEVFCPCGGAVHLAAIIVDIDSQEENLQLYFDRENGERINLIFPRRDLNETDILKLTTWGVQVKKSHADVLIKSIENQEENAKRLLQHKTLGISCIKGKTIFKGAEAIGVQSAYRGKLRIEPKGNYLIWKEMVEEEVIGHTPLEFLLAVSISGMIVDLLKEKLSVENIICHCIGESSTGKTTGALFAVSTGSAPDFLGNNFVFSFQDTLNSLMRNIPNSYPAVIDEGSLLSNKDMTQMMYSLSSGVEKRRLAKSQETNEPVRFRTALILTSEKSILDQCNQNSGLLVRNFEFTNVQWTRSSESADKIKRVINENYGHVIPMVARALLDKEPDEFVRIINDEIRLVVNHAKKADIYNNLTERAAKQTAIVLTAVDIIKEVLGLNMHKEEIRQFINDHSLVKDKEEVSLGKRAMEFLLQYIAQYHAQFLTERVTEGIRDCKGRLQKSADVILETGEISNLKVIITQNEFINIMKEGRFFGVDRVLYEWRNFGYLQAQKDRFVSRVSIAGVQTPCYVIRLPITETDEISSTTNVKDKIKNECSDLTKDMDDIFPRIDISEEGDSDEDNS